MRLETGSPAPPFRGTDDAGNEVSLDDFTGKQLVIYFYPKAFTPGCTTESCDFRDRYETFVAAGYAIEAIENRDTLSLGDLFGNMDDIFSLQVAGDSMINAGISNGDYVICRRASGAHNGQIVIAIIDENEVTLKRFYHEQDRIRLEPANEAFEPIYSQNCRIEAIVIGLLHSFR